MSVPLVGASPGVRLTWNERCWPAARSSSAPLWVSVSNVVDTARKSHMRDESRIRIWQVARV